MILHIGNLGWVQLGGFFWSRLGSDDLSWAAHKYTVNWVEPGGGAGGVSWDDSFLQLLNFPRERTEAHKLLRPRLRTKTSLLPHLSTEIIIADSNFVNITNKFYEWGEQVLWIK